MDAAFEQGSSTVAPKGRSSYLALLTPSRYAAALAVLYLHWFTVVYPGLDAPGVQSGNLAVLFFFVLSGFILAHVYCPDASARIDVRRFAVARFARIYPAYLVGLLLTLPYYVPAWLHLNRNGAWASVAQPLAVLTLTQTAFRGWSSVWNVPAWSLSVEAFFYLLFPWIGPPLARLRGRAAWIGLGVSVFFASLVSPRLVALVVRSRPEWGDFANRNGLTLLPCFLAGILALAAVRSMPPRLRGKSSPALLGVVLVLLLGIAFASRRENQLAVPFFVTIVMALSLGRAPTALSSALVWGTALGEASYALYIVHYGLLLLWGPLWLRLSHQPAFAWIGFALFAVGATAVSLGIGRWVEAPARSWIRKRLAGAPSKG